MQAGVAVYDVMGRKLKSLHAGTLPEGAMSLSWDERDDGGRAVGAGIYFVRLTTPRGARVAKAVILR